ncbi:MAG: carbohydrate-binding protein, partial [Desertimonas sp.]|nr:carbohydrate-binding protein [Desertimonas sp.]
ATRPKVTVRLHAVRAAKGQRVASRRLAKLKAGKAVKVGVRVKVPAALAAGRYYATLCVKSAGGKACQIAGRRATVKAPTTGPVGGVPAPAPAPVTPTGGPNDFSVLVFTESRDTGEPDDHTSTDAGVDAIRALGRANKFQVTVAPVSEGVFRKEVLENYRVVVFLNTFGNVLTEGQQAAFEEYYKAGGGFVAIHGAIKTEPDWPFFTQLLGTRASGDESELDAATIKVADRVHDATKTLPLRWRNTDRYYDFTSNVRGLSHVLATVDENTFAGGSMGHDHPISWCKDYEGGRSFYVGAGHTAEAFGSDDMREHLGGAIQWAAGESSPVYSDCGATVLANYQQVKISAPPNLNEPIGFDQLPDGRIIQTVRDGRVRLHDPETGESEIIADLRANMYTNSEDGLYGPAVDNDFATNRWVYLYYSPINMSGISDDGTPYPAQTPPGAAPTTAASISEWDKWKGYFQLSRFKFVEGADGPRLDIASEQKIMKVENNRGACCHVAGDIDFDKHNNLWLVTGDDTPAGGGNSGGFSPHNDMKTNETQAVRVFNATAGTFTLTFNGQTTAALPFNATAAQVQTALRALSNLADTDVVVTGGPANTANLSVSFRGAYTQQNLAQMTADSSALTVTPTPTATAPVATTAEGSATTNERQTVRTLNATGGTFTITFQGQTTAALPFNATAAEVQAALIALSNVGETDVTVTGGPANTANLTVLFSGALGQTDLAQMTTDASALTVAPAALVITTQEGDWFQAPQVDARRSSLNTNDLRGKVLRIKVNADASYTVPAGNLFAPGTAKTRSEIYAMGFRNPFRIQVDSDDVAYVTDYSPDSQTPENFRGPAGTGRVEIVRKASNYGWPLCYSPTLPYYKWDFNTSTTLGAPYECDNPTRGPQNTSRWNTGLEYSPPITQPDIWYSYRDNAVPPLGTPCFAYYNGSGATSCPQLFPELGTGGVGPHGADKYEWDESNPSETKFPPYYDDAIFLGEFTRDYLREVRLDEQNNVFKINQTLNCGQVTPTTTFPFECDNPMDMQFGADGNLYLLTYGDGFFVANPDAGMYRFEYVAGPQKPRAVASATPTNGVAPLTVQFSSAGSRDPDVNDSIRFEWDFQNDGTVDSTDPNPTFTYTANGKYTVKLTVYDASGKSDSKTLTIVVGNTAPTVTINTPVDGDFFEWGQKIPYTVTVTDPQDQAGGAAIDCSRVEVTLVLVHDTHGHGEITQTGCSGTLQTAAEDASHGGYIAAGISASYTDLGANGQEALTSTTQHVVQTRRQQVEYAQELSGLTTPAVGAPEVDPGGGQIVGSLDAGDWLALNNRYYFGNMDNSIAFRFAQATAAGALRGMVEVRLDAVDGPIVGNCELRSTGDNNVYTTQTCPLTLTAAQEAAPHRIYLVFRQATGGPAAGFGNLNWVQFSGPGWGTP